MGSLFGRMWGHPPRPISATCTLPLDWASESQGGGGLVGSEVAHAGPFQLHIQCLWASPLNPGGGANFAGSGVVSLVQGSSGIKGAGQIPWAAW